MKKSLTLFFVITIFVVTQLYGQMPVDVAENTLKVKALGEEVFYYGFAEGDQLIFSFQEINGKELKEIEILELPSSSKFMDYKTSKVENKTISITHDCICKFTFTNSAITGRICKFKIQRIPANSSTLKFNTSVYWRTIYDTTYTTEYENYLVKSDTVVSNIIDQVAKVHSQTGGATIPTNFRLPSNTISWSYYIGVDQAGKDAFNNAAEQLAQSASPMVAKIPGYGPLAALALGATPYLAHAQGSESVDYYIVDVSNVNLFNSGQAFYSLKKGTIVNDFSKMSTPLEGQYYVCLINQNLITGIDVTLKITAVIVNNEMGTRPIRKAHISSRSESYLQK